MSKATILMIEDDRHIMNINRSVLTRQGYRLLEAETLRDGAVLLERENPDLIILDVRLPDGSGLDFCALVREQRNTPVLLLTAFGEADDIVAGFNAGCDDYLPKPYDPKVLTARVEGLLRRVIRAETVKRGALSLNVARQQAFVNGKDAQLTRMQFVMLYYFVRNEGRVIQAERLYREVWGRPMAEDDTAVKTAISRLRDKIEPAGFQIEAVRGSGYRFKENSDG